MPNASRIGPMIASSGVFGIDLEGGGLLADLEGQSRALFANMVRICEAAGATLEHPRKGLMCPSGAYLSDRYISVVAKGPLKRPTPRHARIRE